MFKNLSSSFQTNSADTEQTASEEAVWSGFSLLAILTSILCIPKFYLREFKILEQLPY